MLQFFIRAGRIERAIVIDVSTGEVKPFPWLDHCSKAPRPSDDIPMPGHDSGSSSNRLSAQGGVIHCSPTVSYNIPREGQEVETFKETLQAQCEFLAHFRMGLMVKLPDKGYDHLMKGLAPGGSFKLNAAPNPTQRMKKETLFRNLSVLAKLSYYGLSSEAIYVCCPILDGHLKVEPPTGPMRSPEENMRMMKECLKEYLKEEKAQGSKDTFAYEDTVLMMQRMLEVSAMDWK